MLGSKLLRAVLEIRSSSLARSAAVLTGATAIGQLIIMVSSPVLTRLYSPEEFGLLAAYVAVLAPLIVVGSLSYQLAIPIATTEVESANVLALSLGIVTVLGSIAAVLVLGFPTQIANLIGIPSLADSLWVLPLGFIGGASYQALEYWSVRLRDFRGLARTKLSRSIGLVLAQLGLGAAGFGVSGLLAGDTLGRATGSASLIYQALRRSASSFRSVSWHGVMRAGRRFSRFPLVSTWSSFLNAATLSVPPLLLTFYYGPATAGFFALSQQVIAVPMRTLGQSVGHVYVGSASRLAKTDPAKLRVLFRKTISHLLLLGALPFLLLAAVGGVAFTMVFGDQWRDAGVFSQLLASASLLQFISVPVSQTLNALERLGTQLAWDGFRLVAIIGALIAAGALGGQGAHAVAAYSIVMTAAYAAQLCVSYRAIMIHERMAR